MLVNAQHEIEILPINDLAFGGTRQHGPIHLAVAVDVELDLEQRLERGLVLGARGRSSRRETRDPTHRHSQKHHRHALSSNDQRRQT